MKIVVTSNYAVIREGIVSLISKYKDTEIILASESLYEAMFMIRENLADLVLVDTNNDNEKELELIETIKNFGVTTKLVVIDFYGNKEYFIKALKYGVQGYIFGKSTEEEFMYAIEQVYKGKKYFDSYFVDSMINENLEPKYKMDMLTTREREILMEVAKGLSNRKISEKLFITEHTVKKHINHILDKLNISDRTEAALYANKFELVRK
jgi:two-component system nitrate/nitrite response regulator NarL